MILPDKVYDILKWICITLLPALTVLWVALAKIWGWPLVGEIAGTMAAIETFMGAILGISTIQYNRKKLNTTN